MSVTSFSDSMAFIIPDTNFSDEPPFLRRDDYGKQAYASPVFDRGRR
jgi:hypothetical protein